MGISSMRGNVTEFIWQMTHKMPVLHQGNWTSSVVNRLQVFYLVNMIKITLCLFILLFFFE